MNLRNTCLFNEFLLKYVGYFVSSESLAVALGERNGQQICRILHAFYLAERLPQTLCYASIEELLVHQHLKPSKHCSFLSSTP